MGDGDGEHYQTLGLRRDASKADVKAAFSRLALLHHPDRHARADAAARADATRRFRQAYEAYHVLYDDRRRVEYDLRYYSYSSASSGCKHRQGHGGSTTSSSSSSASYGGGHHRGHGDASPSSSASAGYGCRHERDGDFHNWPSEKGSESLGVWARANWYPLLCCTLRLAEILIDSYKIYSSWRSSRESIEKEAPESFQDEQ